MEGDRTERGVIISCDIALHAGYHYRLVHSIHEAVDVHTLEGIAILRGGDEGGGLSEPLGGCTSHVGTA